MTDTASATTPGTAPEQGADGPSPATTPRGAATTPAVPEERLRSLLSGIELREWLAGVSGAEDGAAEALLRNLADAP